MLRLALFPLLAAAMSASAQSPEGLLEGALKSMSLSPQDLQSRPGRWDTRSRLKALEDLIEDPLKLPAASERWSGALARYAGPADLMDLAGEILAAPPEAPKSAAPPPPFPESKELTAPLSAEIRELVFAIAAARPLLDRAVATAPRKRLAEIRSLVLGEDHGPLSPALFDEADAFDEKSLLSAAQLVARAAEGSIAGLRENAGGLSASRVILDSPAGKVLVASAAESVFSVRDVEDAAVLIHLGGKSRYEAPPARARQGQVRVVIDLADDVELDAPGGGAGSGELGIGLLYLPGERGVKRIRAGDVSLGAGLFGAGAFTARGRLELSGGRFSMGAGAYGVGVFAAQGDGARLTGGFASQGFGFVKGVGLFRLRGDGARVEGGLSEPDPHEAQASLSFCQGAGLGPRAYAAGGAGLALVEGKGSSLTGSYFSQGAGYWHGFGSLSVVGDGNFLKARRYGQGSGVHTAAGALSVKGNGNELVNWGVGPAFGWDLGMGWFGLEGSGNSVSAEWGTGHGDVNGHALATVIGDGNKLSLPEFGSGAFKRGAGSYGVAAVAGKGNRFRFASLQEPATGFVDLAVNPWGILEGALTLDPALAPPKADWPVVERAKKAQEDRERLARRLAEAGAPSDWLSIAASESLDGEIPRRALERLFSLSPDSAPALAGLVSSDRFDEFIWLRPLLASFGAPIVPELAHAQATRKAMLLGLLLYGKTEAAVPEAVKALSDGDWRIRRAGAALLGGLFDREEGEEPGRLRLLEAIGKGGEERDFLSAAGFKRQTELFGALALDPGFSTADRLSFFQRTPGPFDPLPTDSLRDFLRIVGARPRAYRDAVASELKSAAALEGKARQALIDALSDSDREVVSAAVLALGQMGSPEDAARLSPFLENDAALLRDAAAAALGKMGKAAPQELEKALASSQARTRAWAALAAAQSTDPAALALLAKAFADHEESVRRAAVSSLAAVQVPLRIEAKKLSPAVRELALKDPSPSVRATAAALAPGL